MKKKLSSKNLPAAPVFEELEPRVLFSAGMEGFIAGDVNPHGVTEFVVDDNLQLLSAANTQQSNKTGAEQHTLELVFIDADTPDREQLLDDLLNSEDSANRRFEVIELSADRDGVEQISETLNNYQDVDAIHIVSHGSDGNINLGGSTLNADNFVDYQNAISGWSDSLDADADILIYGCNLAASTAGQTLIDNLSAMTTADLAASVDLTGNLSLGGDWDLEYVHGSVETAVAFSLEAQRQFSGLLMTPWDDIFYGTPGADIQDTGANPDLLLGLGGNDILQGGSGNDILHGGSGNDILQGGSGDDILVAGGGGGTLTNVSGDNTYFFTGAQDGDSYTVNGGTGTDTIDLSEFGADAVDDSSPALITVDLGGGQSFTILHNNIDTIVKAEDGGINHAPQADASTDQSVTVNSLVTLDASASSDLDLDTLSYEWVQLQGPSVGITGSTAQSPSFTAPSSAANLSFAVIVMDDGSPSLSNIDIVNVTVTGATIEVTTTLDNLDGDTSSLASFGADNPDGLTSLREAIELANNTAGTDTITFNIVGAGPHTIQPGSALPDITDAVIIDGTTEPDFAGTPIIELDGSSTGAGVDGIRLVAGSDGSTIRGLVINQFGQDGIDITSDNHTIVGNYIGTDTTGLLALGNGNSGVNFDGGINTLIGGTTAADRNVIAGNLDDGVEIDGGSGHIVQGNYIGVGADGVTSVGNAGVGVKVSVSNVIIGGDVASAGNIIANHLNPTAVGVWVTGGATDVSILGNSIYNSTELGIELGAPFGVNPNDIGDVDTGNNNQQNFPVITSSVTDGAGNLMIDGTLNTDGLNQDYRIEFFASMTADTSGTPSHGEAERYLGFVNVTTDGSGDATFSTVLSVTVAAGEFITVTATVDLGGGNYSDTSEFAKNAVAINSAGASLVVDTTSDTSDGDTTSISTLLADKGADGFISLREAIIATNNTTNGTSPDEIQFNIAGAGPHTISIGAGGLPDITDTVVIDGTTEPDFVGTPMIELDGSSAGAADGLRLIAGSDGSTIRGLVINQFEDDGIEINNSDNNSIQGSYIGTDTAGTMNLGNINNGVNIKGNASGNLIGGTTAAERNVISGNSQGIRITGASTTGNTVIGNYIGTDVTGLVDLGNSDDGIEIDVGASGNTIGGTTAAERNVISGNNDDGFSSDSNSNVVQGNYIGVGADGTTSLGNSSDGVELWGASSSNRIGGTLPGQANLIRHSGGDGISVSGTGSGNQLLGNSISANGGLGVDLGDDGVTTNDGGDGDTGANNLQNFPQLFAASTDGATTTISGQLNSAANTTYRIEFFANGAGTEDASNHGEGQTYLGFTLVTTDASGYAAINASLGTVVIGDRITATATSAADDTSEFAANITATSTQNRLWISTDNDGVPPGADGLPGGWTQGEALNFAGPDLTLGSATDGDFSGAIDFDLFTADAVDVGALHFVASSHTIGSGANQFDIHAGDVLVSFNQDETILAAYSETGADMLVHQNDLLAFRPDTPGDYTSGTFYMLLDGVPDSTGTPISSLHGISLVEQDTLVGSTLLPAGSFIFSEQGGSAPNNIYHFTATSAGSAAASGTTITLIDGEDIGIDAANNSRIRGLALISSTITIGGETLNAGEILVTLNVDDASVGTAPLISTATHDIFVLSVTNAEPDGGITSATARMLLDGSDVNLDGSERIYALAVVPGNLAPNVDLDDDNSSGTSGNDYATTFDEAIGAVILTDSDAVILDVNGAELSSLTATITNLFDGSDELLGANVSGTNISANYVSATGVLTLSGIDTVANYQQVLRTIFYNNLSDDPNTTDRIITFIANDGTSDGSTATTTLTVVAENDVPQWGGLSGARNYTENDPGLFIQPIITIQDIDSPDFDGGTLTVHTALGGTSNDVFQIIPGGNVTLSGSDVLVSGTTVGTFSGGAAGTDLVISWNANSSPAVAQEVARRITYSNTSDSPTTTTRAINFVLTDGDGGTSSSAQTQITPVPQNDDPVLTPFAGGGTYTEGSATGTYVYSAIEITDVDSSDFDGGTLTFTIAANGEATDQLYVRDQGTEVGEVGVSGSNITYNFGAGAVVIGSFTGGNGASNPFIVTFNANSDVTSVQAVARRVSFQNTSDNPSPAQRTIDVFVTDGDGGTSLTYARAMDVVPVNDAPTATNLSALEAYTEDTALDLTDIVVSDVDHVTTTVTLTLSDVAAGSLSTGTSGAVTSTFAGGVWTASGAISNVNILLAGVTFTPATNYSSDFSIATSVSDGVALPVTGSKAFTATAVNDAPTATNLSAPESYVEDTALNLVDIVVSDVDHTTTTVTLTLSDTAAGVLSTGTSGAVTSTFAGGVWTASGAISDVNILLAGVTFTPATNYSSDFSIATSVSDGVALPVTGSKAFTATAVNDAPTATNLSTPEAYTEDTALDLADIVVSDVDHTTATVTLTLSDVAAGSLSTGTSGAVTSTFAGGVWTASGAISDVNILLAGVTFTPATNYSNDFSIATSVSDGVAPAVTGSKAITATAVNDAPTATNLNAPEAYTEDTALNLTDIVVSDVDHATTTVTLTLSDVAAGSLSTGTSGAVTSTFTAGVWTASGNIADVNTLLAGVTFTPASNYNSDFSIATSVDDGIAPAVTGVKNVTGIADNDQPTWNNLSGARNYTENDPGLFIQPIISITDIDSPDFAGGTLTVHTVLGGTSNDVFQVMPGGNVTLSGSDVLVSGTIVGTVSGGVAGTDLVINWNANSSPAAAQEVARRITYSNTSDTPTTTTRVINFVLTDGDGGTSSSAQTHITPVPQNDDPVLASFAGGGTYTEGSGTGTYVYSAIGITDVDSSDFDGGTLTFTIAANGGTTDQLYVRDQGTAVGEVGVSGSDITYNFGAGAVVIGSTTGGNGASNPFVVTFNANSDAASVQAVARRVSFQNTSDDPSAAQRTIDVFVTDGDGGTSSTYSRTMDVVPVNDAPVAQNDPESPGYSALLAAQNPLSYWRLGETSGSTTNDSGSSGAVGAYTGGVLLNQQGALATESDAGVYFDGVDDYVEVMHHPDYLIAEGAVQLWFNADTSVGTFRTLFSKDANGSVSGGHLSASISSSGYLTVRLQSTSNSYVVSSANPVTAGSWHHMAVNFGSGGMELYLDGDLIDTNTYAGGLDSASSGGATGNLNPVVIGAGIRNSGEGTSTPVGEFFAGSIDEVAIFNSRLSADVVADLYAGALQNFDVTEDSTLNVAAENGVLVNDHDPEGDAITAILNSGPANSASFILNGDGSFSYTPNPDFQGTDTFTYYVNDGTANSNIATATITVLADNDPASVAITGSAQEYATLTANVSDVDGVSGGVAYQWRADGVDIAAATAGSYTLTAAEVGKAITVVATYTDDQGFSETVTSAPTAPVSNINDTPNIADQSFTVAENSANGTVVGTVVASDPDASDALTYSISGGNVGGAFAIDSVNGTITVADSAALDFETSSAFALTVQVEDNGAPILNNSATVTINLNDLNEFAISAIADADASANAVREDAIAGTTVGVTALATDADATAAVSYSLDNDADGRFAIDSQSGVITVVGALDAAIADGHTVVVRATSSDGSSTIETFSIAVVALGDTVVPPQPDDDPVIDIIDNTAPPTTLPDPADQTDDATSSEPAADEPELVTDEEIILDLRSSGTGTVNIVVEQPASGTDLPVSATTPVSVELVAEPVVQKKAAAVDQIRPQQRANQHLPGRSLDSFAVDEVLADHAIWAQLDEMKRDIEADDEAMSEQELIVKVVTGSTLTLSAGFVSWLLRGGTLLASLLSTLPVWKGFDPLPILAAKRRKEEDERKKREQAEKNSANSNHVEALFEADSQ